MISYRITRLKKAARRALLLFAISTATGMVTLGQATFDQRTAAIIDEYAITTVTGDVAKCGFWYAQANFAKRNSLGGRTVLDQTLNSTPEDPPFAYWACMDAYLRWNATDYTQSQRGETRDFMTSFTGYNEGSSQNHQIMLATARYLASEEWAPGSFAGGSEFANGDPTGKQFLLAKMDEWVHKGIIEHDSPIYIMFHLGPMRSLADLATDPEIRNMARLAFEWILINAGNEWMNGHMASSSLRNLFPYDAQNEYYETDFALWLYFGGKTPLDFNLGSLPRACFSVGMAVSDYELPSIISDIANAKNEEFTNRESHAVDTEWNLNFRKTTFMDGDRYALYSQAELPPGENSGLNQQSHRWGLVWESINDDSRKSAFWIKHGRRDISSNRAGTTRYEQVLQNERTLVSVCDIPATDDVTFTEGFVSDDYSTFIDTSDKIYFHYGNVLLAVISPKEILWNEGDERIRLDHLKNGFVIETASPDRYSGTAQEELISFQAEIESSDRLAGSDVDGDQPRLIYSSIYGYTLDIQYQGDRKIDDQTVDYTSWPLMWNPWVQQTVGDDTLTLIFQDTSRVYDFGNWKVIGEPEVVLSVNDELVYEDVTVFPNPARDRFLITLPSLRGDSIDVTLIDSSGRMIYKRQVVRPKESDQLEISMDHLKVGVYWLKLAFEKREITKKVLIQR